MEIRDEGQAAIRTVEGPPSAFGEHRLHLRPIDGPTSDDGLDEVTASPAPEKGTRAVVYLRVSSQGQVKTDYDPEGISLPAQRLACQKKADQLGLTVVGEYVEAGRSATEMTKRVDFQRMLERIRRDRDVDFVIVYKLSRFARNQYDDAITMVELQKRGVTLISASESIDASPVGRLMHGVLAAFNDYQSRENGADIAYKLGQKAKNGGTISKAPIGYANVVERYEGRNVRSVAIDEVRAPFVRLAFELFATGDYSYDEVADELTDRGLVIAETARRPEHPISRNKVIQLLRDRYYLGEIVYKDESFPGRHPALVDAEVFDRVQVILRQRNRGHIRHSRHHTYLKGSLFCGRCRLEDGTVRRMILQRTIGRGGDEYRYFFCRGVQEHACNAPYSNDQRVERAVLEHYRTIKFQPEFVSAVRESMTATLADAKAATRLLRRQIKEQLAVLDGKEGQLLDLVGDPTMPQDSIRIRLRELKRQREKLETQYDASTDDLDAGVAFIEAHLRLLENPYELYRNASDEMRRALNQLIFVRIYVVNDRIVDHELRSPLAELLEAQHDFYAQKSSGGTRLETQKTAGDANGLGVLSVLGSTDRVNVSSNALMVDLRGLEPLTPCMPCRCATSCATDPDVPLARPAECTCRPQP